MPAHFLVTTPLRWLRQYPRYLAAVQARLRKLIAGGGNILVRDAQATAEIASLWAKYREHAQRNEIDQTFDPELDQFRWMIEEYRVSLFAQEIGTLLPVSAKRLDTQWAKVRK